MTDILLCSDLDRTILPNGKQEASEKAIGLLHRLHSRPELTLAYVSGRDKRLLQQAIEEFDIPIPDFAIGDVGTTIYEPEKNWRPWPEWTEEIAGDWRGTPREKLQELLADLSALRLQEQEKQGPFKLSYYSAENLDPAALKKSIRRRLQAENIKTSIIWSIDEEKGVGLLDILPERATKVHAIRFLMGRKGFSPARTVFAGDSGNDLPALTSGLQAILVKNAREDVRNEALQSLALQNLEERLYLARGNFLGMNGNYCAGVLEGVAHFFPETLTWLKAESDRS